MAQVRAYDKIQLGPLRVAGFAKEPPPFIDNSRVRGVRRVGQVYDARTQGYLTQLFEGNYLPSPWLIFQAANQPRPYLQYCQPDGLIFDWSRRVIVIVEIKLRHTPDAFWQVTNLYRPVLEHAFHGRRWHFRQLEVVKWYDPSTYFPCDVTMVSDPLLTPRKGMGVHIWKP